MLGPPRSPGEDAFRNSEYLLECRGTRAKSWKGILHTEVSSYGLNKTVKTTTKGDRPPSVVLPYLFGSQFNRHFEPDIIAAKR